MAGKHQKMYFSFFKIALFVLPIIGIEIHRDGATAKRLTMQGFDPWFLMNLLSMIAE